MKRGIFYYIISQLFLDTSLTVLEKAATFDSSLQMWISCFVFSEHR